MLDFFLPMVDVLVLRLRAAQGTNVFNTGVALASQPLAKLQAVKASIYLIGYIIVPKSSSHLIYHGDHDMKSGSSAIIS